MPQIIVRGMQVEDVKQLSYTLPAALSRVIGCPEEHIILEYWPTKQVRQGEFVEGDPLIQVNWFDRDEAVQDETAAVIEQQIRTIGYSQVEIYFVILAARKYYENGQHY